MALAGTKVCVRLGVQCVSFAKAIGCEMHDSLRILVQFIARRHRTSALSALFVLRSAARDRAATPCASLCSLARHVE